MSDESEAADRQLRHAVDESLAVYGFARDDLISVDIAVLVSQRGFDGDDGISRVALLQPTDTSNFSLLGMLAEARLEVEETILNTLRARRGDDD